jgi:hypothetical protein
VCALPTLLRRVASWRTPHRHVDIDKPIRVHRDRFLNHSAEFKRHVLLANAKCGRDGWVLIVLDADDDCPARLGPTILARAEQLLAHRRVSVVLPNREFEAWFIGAAASLHGSRGLGVHAKDLEVDAEAPRNAKGWLRERMASGTYGEMSDQAAFAATMDLQQAFDRCRSFRKLCGDWDRHCAHVLQESL